MPITTARGVALYVGALLGPGLLVLPGLAAQLAGPASILVWAGLLVLSGLVAIVFARLGVVLPGAGGVAGYARAGLGAWAGRAAAWCFLAGIVAGAPVVCVLGAGYLPGPHTLVAGLLLTTVVVIAWRGVHASTTVQLGLLAVLVALIGTAVLGGLPAADGDNWAPFAPHGWGALGGTAAALMMAFVGWEAIAPLTDRFADPARQLPRVIGAAFAVTAVTYLALAAVTVAALGGGSAVPIADLLRLGLGPAGPAVAAVGATVLTLGAVNAYVTGGTAQAGRWFPVAVLLVGVVALGLLSRGLVPVTDLVTVPSTLFTLVYLGCMAAAARLLTGPVRWAAVVAAVGSVVVLAYSGWSLLFAVAVALAAGLTGRRGPQRRMTGTEADATAGRGTATEADATAGTGVR